LGYRADLSLPTTAEVKNDWSYTSTPHPYVFMACTGTTSCFMFFLYLSFRASQVYNI